MAVIFPGAGASAIEGAPLKGDAFKLLIKYGGIK
jgi:hypothetical protein